MMLGCLLLPKCIRGVSAVSVSGVSDCLAPWPELYGLALPRLVFCFGQSGLALMSSLLLPSFFLVVFSYGPGYFPDAGIVEEVMAERWDEVVEISG